MSTPGHTVSSWERDNPFGQVIGLLKLWRAVSDREERLLQLRGPVFPTKPLLWSLYATVFTTPRILQYTLNRSSLAAWYNDVLSRSESKEPMYVVAGEMSFALFKAEAEDETASTNDIQLVSAKATQTVPANTVDAFRAALEGGRDISLICGPQLAIWEDEPESTNPIVDFVSYQGQEGKGKFSLFVIPESFGRPSHFAICGHCVYVELPHLPTAMPAEILGKAIDGSVFWLNHLISRFQDLLDNKKVIQITPDNRTILDDVKRKVLLRRN